MTTVLMPVPKQQYFNSTNQRFLAGGKLYTYAAGTTTPKATYTDSAGATPQENPIILNARGEPDNPIYWDGSYKVVLKDAAGSTIYTVDNYKSDPFGIVAFIASLAASAGSTLIGFLQAGANAVLRTVQSKLRETVSIEDFGAVDGSLADASAAIIAAAATGKAIRIPGKYVVSTAITIDRSNLVLIGDNPGYSEIISKVATGYTMTLGTTAVPAKGGLVVRGLIFTRSSGTTSCLRITENLDAVVEYNTFTGFSDYAIEANQSDGIQILHNLIFGGSVKLYSEMDRAIVAYNDIQASPNHPCLEIYGGSAQSIYRNFLNWSQHEAIVLGYDSVRGDYSQCPSIRNNYIERVCQTDNGSLNRPFIHIGKPIDQTGAAYAGTEVVRWAEIDGNYINADVTNANLAKVVPALFERALEVHWDGNRPINFTNGGGNALYPRIKYPLRNFRSANHNTKYVDLSSGGNGAYQQFLWPALSMYRPVEVFMGGISITTDGTGAGNYTFSNIDTGVNGLDTGRMIILATPQNDCRVNTSNYSVSSGTASDGSDLIGWKVNVIGGPASSTVGVVVFARVLVP
jgi:hypothetical protein